MATKKNNKVKETGVELNYSSEFYLTFPCGFEVKFSPHDATHSRTTDECPPDEVDVGFSLNQEYQTNIPLLQLVEAVDKLSKELDTVVKGCKG